ncbi:hypothetical protein BGX38DRAFT_219911 [Terfezia claveryi]|nr:hypothetical protein BGX38DRAFT_219911 [Terfezia claveryi]
MHEVRLPVLTLPLHPSKMSRFPSFHLSRSLLTAFTTLGRRKAKALLLILTVLVMPLSGQSLASMINSSLPLVSRLPLPPHIMGRLHSFVCAVSFPYGIYVALDTSCLGFPFQRIFGFN